MPSVPTAVAMIASANRIGVPSRMPIRLGKTTIRIENGTSPAVVFEPVWNMKNIGRAEDDGAPQPLPAPVEIQAGEAEAGHESGRRCSCG